MNRVLLQVSRSIGVCALVTLILWLNGLGCSLCCATGATAVSTLITGACVTSDCCKREQTNNTPTSKESISGTTAIGCSLLPHQEAATLPRVSVDLPDNSGITATFAVAFHNYTQPVFALNHPPPLNRGGTYLRCCVLLI
jgi:hypothetical protein